MNNHEVEVAVQRDMSSQMRWHLILNPLAGMLKFRLPYSSGEELDESVTVSPDDDDNMHLQVIEQWAHSPQGGQSMQHPDIAGLVNKHAQLHIQSEQMKNGIKAKKAAGTQGSLGDPRAAKVASQAR